MKALNDRSRQFLIYAKVGKYNESVPNSTDCNHSLKAQWQKEGDDADGWHCWGICQTCSR